MADQGDNDDDFEATSSDESLGSSGEDQSSSDKR
jgi:hypothetical protein